MNPVTFPEANSTLMPPKGVSEEQVRPLPCFRDGVQVLSCWRPTWRERLSILFFGVVWLAVLGVKTHPPVWVLARRRVFAQQPALPEKRDA